MSGQGWRIPLKCFCRAAGLSVSDWFVPCALNISGRFTIGQVCQGVGQRAEVVPCPSDDRG